MFLQTLNPIDGFTLLHSGFDLILQIPPVLAQNVDVDIGRDFVRSWNHVLRTGQLWAFLMGIVAGWAIRSLFP